MKRLLLVACVVVAIAAVTGATSQGEDQSRYHPLTAAPEQHEALFENEFVLVLDVSIPGGTTVPAHQHPWPAVFITLSPGHLIFRNLAGEVVRELSPPAVPLDGPQVQWREPDAEPIVISNVGTAEQRALRIEMKFLPR